MAGFAQCDEITFIMSPSLRDWKLMMNLLGHKVSSIPQALLTEWVGSSVAVTDAFPGSAIAPSRSRVTVIAFVSSVLLFLMLFAKALVG
jgi:hypothetical protein